MAKDETITDAKEIAFCDGDIGYSGIVEHINDGVVIIKEGRIVFANKAFYEICRKPFEDIFGIRILSTHRSSGQGRGYGVLLPREHCPTFFQTGSNSPWCGPRRRRSWRMKVNTVQCAGTPAILGALTDITERRKTRLELQRIKDRLASILDSMNDVVVSISPKDHSILAINPSAEALYGIPVRDFSSGKKHVMDFVHPRDAEKVKEFYASLPELEFAELAYRISSANKTTKWFSTKEGLCTRKRAVYAGSIT